MKQQNWKAQFVVCIKNEGYAASLELRKIYQVTADVCAAQHQLVRVRVIDESSEDCLYSADYFVTIKVQRAVEEVFALSVCKRYFPTNRQLLGE